VIEIILSKAITWSSSPFPMCCLGAFSLLLMTRIQDRVPLSVLGAMNFDVSNKGKPSTIILDLILSTLLGSIIVVVLAEPETAKQSIVAGLGMSGLLSTYTKEAKKSD
jgi:uncharacterized membrane protein